MADDRAELLRTQSVHHVMAALGAANVQIYGNDPMAGGVFLDNEQQVTSRTYWHVDGTRFEYSVRVTVDVTRKAANDAR